MQTNIILLHLTVFKKKTNIQKYFEVLSIYIAKIAIFGCPGFSYLGKLSNYYLKN